MEDLGNERRAVVQQLRSMGIEPVNAEDMPPDGRSSWGQATMNVNSYHKLSSYIDRRCYSNFTQSLIFFLR